MSGQARAGVLPSAWLAGFWVKCSSLGGFWVVLDSQNSAQRERAEVGRRKTTLTSENS